MTSPKGVGITQDKGHEIRTYANPSLVLASVKLLLTIVTFLLVTGAIKLGHRGLWERRYLGPRCILKGLALWLCKGSVLEWGIFSFLSRWFCSQDLGSNFSCTLSHLGLSLAQDPPGILWEWH